MLTCLRYLAKGLRKIGLGFFVDQACDIMDKVCIRLNWFPLSVEVNGFTLCGLFRHYSFTVLLAKGYEVYLRKLFLQSLKPGMVVVDGGAHIGLYSVLASQKVGETGVVFSIEPDPFNLAALKFNVRKTGCNNVNVVACALADKVGYATFYSDSGTFGSSLFRRSDRSRKVTPFSVQTTTIDHLLERFVGRSLLIKLDLEGAEPLAVRGMEKIVQSSSEITLISEINPSALKDGGWTEEDFITMLKNFGFRIKFIDEKEQRLVPLGHQPLRKGNLFCHLKRA